MRALIAVFLITGFAAASEPAATVNLWPGKPPGETKDLPPEVLQKNKPGDTIARLENVSIPTIAVYKPVKEKNTGTAVVVAPGGGYHILAIEHEGTKVCEWLNSQGVTAILLKYRVPKRVAGSTLDSPAALQDGQRAMCLARANAEKWGYDPNRIGMLGFSAGAHLTASVSCFDKRAYESVDDADKVSCTPNFAVLIYPGGLIKDGKLKPEFSIGKNSPPAFLAMSTDDPVNPENCLEYYRALKKANVPAEMHLYATGGHGYGINKVPHDCASWPDRCAEWMTTRGYLKK
jgi:acetyl esterase/lipase